MDLFNNTIHELLHNYGLDRTYWIAYSGGLDSHVLLHLMARMPVRLQAVHINHGVSPHAVQWAEHCARVCQALNVNLVQHTLTNQNVNPAHSPEDQLRQSRYQVIAKLLQPHDILLTAHQQNDQAETVLLQLVRGAGPKGLAAMPRVKPFAAGLHVRPLLDFTRADLINYARAHQLQWIEDESNGDETFTRNFLRHQIMPLLINRWPSVTHTIARSAEHCATTQEFIDNTTQQLLLEVMGTQAETISVKKFLQLPSYQQNHVLRAWILRANFPLPSSAKMQQILQTILHARADRIPHVAWGDVEIRRYRDDLFLLCGLEKNFKHQVIEWNFAENLLLPGVGQLRAVQAQQGFRRDIPTVTVRFRQGGETLRLPGRKHHHDLKKLFQQWGVPTWLRDRVPLIYVENTLAAVVGFCIADTFQDEIGWQLQLSSLRAERSNPGFD